MRFENDIRRDASLTIVSFFSSSNTSLRASTLLRLTQVVHLTSLDLIYLISRYLSPSTSNTLQLLADARLDIMKFFAITAILLSAVSLAAPIPDDIPPASPTTTGPQGQCWGRGCKFTSFSNSTLH